MTLGVHVDGEDILDSVLTNQHTSAVAKCFQSRTDRRENVGCDVTADWCTVTSLRAGFGRQYN